MTPKLTAAGRNLLLRGLSGENINFTKVQLGNGPAQNPEEATALINPLLTLEFTDITVGEAYVTLSAGFNNSEITQGFHITELGYFATDPDDETAEILYAIGNENEATADYVPDNSSRILEMQCDNLIFIGDAEDVTAEIAGSLVYATKEEFDAHLANHSNPHAVTAEQVGLGNVPNVTTDNQTPSFTEATVAENINSGETLKIIFGKIKYAITRLTSHLANHSNPHAVTAEQVGAARTAHMHNANDINAGVLPVQRGGTGQTTVEGLVDSLVAADAGDTLLDNLAAGSSGIAPIDTDYFIVSTHQSSQTVSGFCRRKITELWRYISEKISKEYITDLHGGSVTIYWGSNGNDQNDGTSSSAPVKTIGRIRELHDKYRNGTMNVIIAYGYVPDLPTSGSVVFSNSSVFITFDSSQGASSTTKVALALAGGTIKFYGMTVWMKRINFTNISYNNAICFRNCHVIWDADVNATCNYTPVYLAACTVYIAENRGVSLTHSPVSANNANTGVFFVAGSTVTVGQQSFLTGSCYRVFNGRETTGYFANALILPTSNTYNSISKSAAVDPFAHYCNVLPGCLDVTIHFNQGSISIDKTYSQITTAMTEGKDIKAKYVMDTSGNTAYNPLIYKTSQNITFLFLTGAPADGTQKCPSRRFVLTSSDALSQYSTAEI